MATSFLAVLRACPEPARPAVGAFIGRAFGLKDQTCQSIVASTPITLVADLAAAEAAALFLALSGITRLGARFEIIPGPGEELPRIDWPKRPSIFRREIDELVADLQVPVPQADGGSVPLITLVTVAAGLRPPLGGRGTAEFKGIQLPEITPFGGTAAITPPASQPATRSGSTPGPRPGIPAPGPAGAGHEAVSRLNELFPDDDGGLLTAAGSQDITSILDRLLPEDGSAAAGSGGTQAGSASSGRRAAALGTSGHAVFLAKIVDEGRRQKAVELIAELAQVSKEEAEALSKKMIIPVLKGATRDEAEAAKQRFAKIGILARVKGPE